MSFKNASAFSSEFLKLKTHAETSNWETQTAWHTKVCCFFVNKYENSQKFSNTEKFDVLCWSDHYDCFFVEFFYWMDFLIDYNLNLNYLLGDTEPKKKNKFCLFCSDIAIKVRRNSHTVWLYPVILNTLIAISNQNNPYFFYFWVQCFLTNNSDWNSKKKQLYL